MSSANWLHGTDDEAVLADVADLKSEKQKSRSMCRNGFE